MIITICQYMQIYLYMHKMQKKIDKKDIFYLTREYKYNM